ncbi:MAG: putative transporter [Paludibacteraceae bacterium]|nr:putative transporter [Paludibacteraceae bacterium]MBR1995905.1 putative transporter [Paludibacteraceae bacterium]
MSFFQDLFTTPSVTQSIVLLTLVVCLGLWCGEHLRIKKFSLGITWILFVGIIFSSLGISIDPQVNHFAKNFGLILFVYSIGLQVGPSFSPFGKSGLKLNLLAIAIVVLGCACTVGLHYLTGIDMATMAGIMSGAVMNTPSLGAVQQAASDIFGSVSPDIAMGYALAYPLSIVGLILSFELIRFCCRVDLRREDEKLRLEHVSEAEPICVDIRLSITEAISLKQLYDLCPIDHMLVSRVTRTDGADELVNSATVFFPGDIIRIVSDKRHESALNALGKVTHYGFRGRERSDHLISRRVVVTRTECNGKRLSTFDVRHRYHATITRINRAGVELLATPDFVLQLGDRIMVVGDRDDVRHVADIFGNELKRLDLPNLMPIFFGIFMGVLLGSLPIVLPGLNQPFKLGLAGGSLIVALLIGRFGPYYNMVTFATTSANMMLRQVGLTMFLAAVGLSVGDGFVPMIINGGYMWIVYGFAITMIPLLIVGFIAYKGMKINFFKVAGLLIGAMTGAPALGYAESLSSHNDQASVTYATVYPLTMFLRVMAGQMLVVFFCS